MHLDIGDWFALLVISLLLLAYTYQRFASPKPPRYVVYKRSNSDFAVVRKRFVFLLDEVEDSFSTKDAAISCAFNKVLDWHHDRPTFEKVYDTAEPSEKEVYNTLLRPSSEEEPVIETDT